MMKTTLKGLFTFAVAACAGMCLTSCIDKDLYDPSYYEQKAKADYATNFESKYGKVAADQTWDFSSFSRTYRATRGAGDIVPQVQENWYNVEQSTINFFKDALVEGRNNREQGKPFIMSVPNNGFGIYPIHQGGASWTWDLHMVVEIGGVLVQDVKVWEKHSNLECQLNDQTLKTDVENSHNKNFEADFGYKRDGETWYDTKHAFTLEPGGWWQNYEYGYNTMQAKAIRTKGIDFNNLPVGANIYFYLDVWDGQDKKNEGVEGRKESSLNQMMVALENVDRPTNIDQKYEVTIIGCEDNSSESSDWDMNDLVFMVVGYPNVPKPVVVEDKKYDEVISKRYMVEDLGSTDDFDFNDIVVDVEEIRTHEIELVNGAKVKDEVVSTKQQAIIRAMGGTIDFELYIGDTNTPWIKSVDSEYSVGTMVNTTNINFKQELAKFDVSGWNPTENNIRVVVKGNPSLGTQPRSIDFPKAGEIPMIIAYDSNVDWQLERESLPKSWE